MDNQPLNQTVFYALADPTRRAILDLLRTGEMDVSSLTRPFDMSMPAISQHLRILRQAGLVDQRRDGTKRFYFLSEKPFEPVEAWLAPFKKRRAVRKKH